jgi:ATP-binding protein involved in chromosome partitioning
VQSTLETGALREFIADVEWGKLDILLIDMPPGTDKLHRLLQIVPSVSLVLLVTTPSDAARFVVRKSVSLVQAAGCQLALLANMCTYSCVSCGTSQPLFGADAARRLAADAGVELWAELPFDPQLAASTDAGDPIALQQGLTARAFAALAERVDHYLEERV